MKVQLIPVGEVNQGVRKHLSVSEAAKEIGCSESAIRRAAKAAGVAKISGRTVRGGILIEANPVPICITYSA
jgi:hypothetical protein